MRSVSCRPRLRQWLAAVLAPAVLAAATGPAAAQKEFPFEAELRLDARPLHGSKRVPWLQIATDGVLELDMWCVSARGRAVVAGTSITIVPASLRDNGCSQERLKLDEDFLARIMAVTSWRWEGPLLVLEGPQPLRWRPASN